MQRPAQESTKLQMAALPPVSNFSDSRRLLHSSAPNELTVFAAMNAHRNRPVRGKKKVGVCAANGWAAAAVGVCKETSSCCNRLGTRASHVYSGRQRMHTGKAAVNAQEHCECPASVAAHTGCGLLALHGLPLCRMRCN